MNLKKLFFALPLALLLLSGCGRSVDQADYIGIDAAKAVALAAAGVSADDASFTTAGLDRRNGTDFYAVDFTAGGENYEYDIDAVTGVIISSQSSAAQGGDLTGGDDGQAASPGTDTPQDPTQTPAGQNPTSNPTLAPSQAPSRNPATQSPDAYIGEERAKEIALEHAGLAAGDVTFLKTRLDWDDGYMVYDVEFYTSDYKEYDYEIDASTGEILSYDYDAEYYTPPASGGSGISREEAQSIALAKVPGATANDIYEFEVDYDDGRLEYEGKILYDGMEYEFEIDGYSGSIRSWESEPWYR